MRKTEALLRWYDSEGRSLPFRGTRDPYRVWLSEIMLQQTQTATVGPYYQRFTSRFPDLRSLAEASLEEVLKLWEGLGYYSRARNLHKTAAMVQNDLGGRWPESAEGLQKLPGIGPYTAAAIASIAFREPVPAIDGNLMRVLSRLYLVEEDIGIPRVRRQLYTLGLELMPADRPGDMNQALMDLGATVCLPGTPDCGRCPLRFGCAAFKAGEPERLPIRAAKRAPRVIPMAVVLITDRGRVYVRQRREKLLQGLYVFWLHEGDDSAEAAAQALHMQPDELQLLGRARHVFTHRVWEMALYHAQIAPDRAPRGGQFVSLEELEALPMPSAMRAALNFARDILKGDMQHG